MVEFEKYTTNEQEECVLVDEYLKLRNILSEILDSLSYEDRIFYIKTFLNNLGEDQYDLCVTLTDKRIDSLESKLGELEVLRNRLDVVLDDMDHILYGDRND